MGLPCEFPGAPRLKVVDLGLLDPLPTDAAEKLAVQVVSRGQ